MWVSRRIRTYNEPFSRETYHLPFHHTLQICKPRCSQYLRKWRLPICGHRLWHNVLLPASTLKWQAILLTDSSVLQEILRNYCPEESRNTDRVQSPKSSCDKGWRKTNHCRTCEVRSEVMRKNILHWIETHVCIRTYVCTTGIMLELYRFNTQLPTTYMQHYDTSKCGRVAVQYCTTLLRSTNIVWSITSKPTGQKTELSISWHSADILAVMHSK